MVLIGCGLSLEGVAGVDQEGAPGEGAAKAGHLGVLNQLSSDSVELEMGHMLQV